MRLLHVRVLQFYEFFDQEIPKYAILSHRWGQDEVSYEDFNLKREEVLNGRYHGYGWTKIVKACRIAQQHGLDWVWIDTCCIDKKSSAELSEAINSMFEWYRGSEQCFAFLPDVPSDSLLANGSGYEESGQESTTAITSFKSLRFPGCEPFEKRNFVQSEWFTRAWTLQELIAPADVLFFNNSYGYIGTKDDLSDLITEATSIPVGYLSEMKGYTIHAASVAERMRWASTRKATRKEDTAYSLLGLFGVNMPLLYGEGEKAFERLQMEIMKTSDDESIFAWERIKHRSVLYQNSYNSRGFAPRIERFTTTLYEQILFPREHYEVTNKGIKMVLPIAPELLKTLESTSLPILMPLNCTADRNPDRRNYVQSVVCLHVEIGRDPDHRFRTQPISRQLRYLAADIQRCESIRFPECHWSEVSQTLEDLLGSNDCPAHLSEYTVVRYDVEDVVDMPVYFPY